MGSVHQGHRARQRKKLLENGPRAFADHELLEMLLYYAIPRRDTNELAHRLLERFGSLQGVFSAPVEELSTVEGVGENAAVLLSLVPQIWQRSLRTMNIQLVDHIIVADRDYVSMAASGLLI